MVDDDVNRAAINRAASSTSPRPRPFSMWSQAAAAPTDALDYVTDYTSWPGLTNRQFSARHLPPSDPGYTAGLPKEDLYDPKSGLAPGPVTSLFCRQGEMATSRSSLLFTFFAQWFTDSILRFNPNDRRRNTSNHDIDLCQIYGLTEDAARLLRKDDRSGELRCQVTDDGEFPDLLCEQDGGRPKVRAEFAQLRATAGKTADEVVDALLGRTFEGRKANLYATGLERGNSSIGYVAISTIFLREHNRLAREIKRGKSSWSGERIFQTARNVNIVLLLKVLVEDYINHIVGHRTFRLDTTFAEDQRWYRPNWIAAEFDLLYRWHGLCPDRISIPGKDYGSVDFLNNNKLLEAIGVGGLIGAASCQPAGKISLGNTPEYLWAAESNSIKMARDFRLRPYNDYRAHFGLAPLTQFSELTSNVSLQTQLRDLYKGRIDDLEFVVGIFAEEAKGGALFGELLTAMVAYDAFTQIFTNPLLSRQIYNPETFSDVGMKAIDETRGIADIVNRNVKPSVRASFDAILAEV